MVDGREQKMTKKEQDLEDSDLSKIIAPEIKNDPFYELIQQLSSSEDLTHVLEIGSSAGGGSTEAFVDGLSKNSGSPQLYCIEISKPRFQELVRTYSNYEFVHCYNRSSVRVDEFPSPAEIRSFYENNESGLRKFPLALVLDWLRQDIEYVGKSGVDADAIETIKSEHDISVFDLVLIDGSEFTGSVEYEKVRGAKLILLDDTNTYKCWDVRKKLMSDPYYDVIADDQSLRNGYSAFRKRSTPRQIDDELPIHFFTIVLNGQPFIRYHEEMLRHLNVKWHWHVVEGVAALKHDTAWSVATGGHVDDSIHKDGRSVDGTSEYLDDLAKRFPENVTIYRKEPSVFWDGKKEMVSAPLAGIEEECLLWQIDSDELWTTDQVHAVHELFMNDPDRTAAYFWCDYFVGSDKIISTRYNYAQNPNQEWLRTWRFKPGSYWIAHEPPTLAWQADSTSEASDLAKINPFRHDETEAVGAVFQHFAYVTEAQLRFKETYYGYKNAMAQWQELQEQTRPGLLRDYLAWVPDATMFDAASYFGIRPIARAKQDGNGWEFSVATQSEDKIEIPPATARPRIAIDGIFWQYLSSGIGRVWENLLREWVKSGFADNVVVLDRAGTAPRLPGVHYRSIRAHDFAATGADSLYLEEVCKELDADLFVSTYYSCPTSTPSVFAGYDMIPEVLSFPLEDQTWKEKELAIRHASAHTMISENSARDLKQVYPDLDDSRIHVAHVGVAPEFDRPLQSEIDEFRTKYELGDHDFALMVGERVGYEGYKNGLLAFRAAAGLPDDRKLILVCVGGHEVIEQSLIDVAPGLDVRRLKLDDDELKSAYAGAHALLYPSKYEGFGMPPLESMACGTPAIVCKNSSLPEVVGGAAIFVDENDPSETVEALLKLYDKDYRTDLVEKGHAQAAKFTFEHTARKMAEVFLHNHTQPAPSMTLTTGAIWTQLRELQRQMQSGTTAGSDVPVETSGSLSGGSASNEALMKLIEAEETIRLMQNSPFWKLRNKVVALLRRAKLR